MNLDRAQAFREYRAAGLPSPVVPTVDSIRAVAAELRQVAAVPRWQGEEGPRWRVIVSPGAMKLTRRNLSRENSSYEETVRQHIGDNWGMTLAPERGKRSTITAWSRESRTRMGYVLKTIDYSPLFQHHGIPALVTLTMPREWEAIAPTPKSFKHLVELLRKRYEYDWKETMTGVWKLEFQRRGAPHLHMLMTPPMRRKPGTGETFTTWLSRTWAQICTSPEMDWDDARQVTDRFNHEMEGTSIDYSKGLQGHSPDMVAAYFSKHGLFGAKDYQNDPPQLWIDAARKEGGVRFWGYWNLERAEGEIELNSVNPHYVNRFPGAIRPADRIVFRHMQQLAKQRSYVRPVEVFRNSINWQTGEVKTRKRKVRRRTKWMNGQAGYISLSNGEQSARELGRLLAWYQAQTPPPEPAQPRWGPEGRI